MFWANVSNVNDSDGDFVASLANQRAFVNGMHDICAMTDSILFDKLITHGRSGMVSTALDCLPE
jgi:hypothetical protein